MLLVWNPSASPDREPGLGTGTARDGGRWLHWFLGPCGIGAPRQTFRRHRGVAPGRQTFRRHRLSRPVGEGASFYVPRCRGRNGQGGGCSVVQRPCTPRGALPASIRSPLPRGTVGPIRYPAPRPLSVPRQTFRRHRRAVGSAADVSSASRVWSALRRQTCRRHRLSRPPRGRRVVGIAGTTGRGAVALAAGTPYRGRKRHPPAGWYRVAVLPLRDLRSYSLRSSGRRTRGASLRFRRPIRAGRPQGTGWSGVHRKLAPGRAADVSSASPCCPVGLSWVCQRSLTEPPLSQKHVGRSSQIYGKCHVLLVNRRCRLWPPGCVANGVGCDGFYSNGENERGENSPAE